MSKVITMQDIRNERMSDIQWKHETTRKDGTSYPLRMWQNLECILEKYNISLVSASRNSVFKK